MEEWPTPHEARGVRPPRQRFADDIVSDEEAEEVLDSLECEEPTIRGWGPLPDYSDVGLSQAEIRAPPGSSLMTKLATSLINQHDLFDFRIPGFYMESGPVHYQPSIDIPEFGELVRIEQVEDTVLWSFEVPLALQESVSFTSSERETRSRFKYKIRHEFVSEALQEGGTDKRLDEVFTPLKDEDDRLTPDITYQDEFGVIHVIEVATSRSAHQVGLVKALNTKLFKYEMPIRNRRLDAPVTYTAIVVGPFGVVSNHDLPQDLANELIVRMRIALALENAAKSKGINITSEESETVVTQTAADLRDRLSNILLTQKKSGLKVEIDDEFIASILQDPEEPKVLENFSLCLERTIAEIKSDEPQSRVVRKYMKKMQGKKDCRSDRKPITVMPLVNVSNSADGNNITFNSVFSAGDNKELTKLWQHAFGKTNERTNFKPENEAELLREAYVSDKKEAQKIEKDRKSKRRHWHRVDLKPALDNSTMKYLRRDGIFGKSAKGDLLNKARKKEQSKPFWIETDVTDIEAFICDKTLLGKSRHGPSKSAKQVVQLIERAEKISLNGDPGSTFLKDWMETKLFQSCDLISDIAYELAIAIKQNVKSSEFILKRVRNRQVYLLIKPTCSRSHIFYSIFIPRAHEVDVLNEGVFRSLHKVSGGLVTDFCSVKANKIENLANLSSHVLTQAAFWSEFYSLEEASPQGFMDHSDASKMLLFTLLVTVEDKTCTEEVITLTRYMYMEVFKGRVNLRKPRPFKMLKKMPELLRSRLTVFCLRKVISCFTTMVNTPPRRLDRTQNSAVAEGEDVAPDDKWLGLLNFITGSDLDSATDAINLMYMGYFKNKNQEAEGNSEWAMVEKILEEEFAMEAKYMNGYRGDLNHKEFPKGKQFDKNSIMLGCSLLEKRMKNTLGAEWKELLGREIAENLSSITTTEISTLKASSTCDHKTAEAGAKMKTSYKTWRVKVIEAIAAKLDLVGLRPMSNIDKILKFIETSSSGVICDLFKKNQHGGLREIYVLTIESRLVQLFLESISRTICSYFEEETLTHPGNKIKILDNHKTRAAKDARARDAIFGDLCSSSDKTRWNQNFVMTAMSIPLFRLTPSLFHGAIARSLNLWADKLIKLPPYVLKLFFENTILSSETFKEASNKFWGRMSGGKNNNGFRKPKTEYLNLTSGMMQGILHFSSSLLHLTFLAACKHIGLKYLKMKYPDVKFTMSQVCSSDDSATILTVMVTPSEMKLGINEMKAFFEADLVMETFASFCEFFCMRESIKSTTSVYDYVEFNSEFLLKNTLGIPIIKMIASCLNLTESSSFIQRFHTMYNLISDLRASGMSSHGTYLCQIAQAWQHYKTLGATVSGLFHVYHEEILKTPSPVHGFFLLDNHLVAGVMGYSFCRWMFYQNELSASERINMTTTTELEVTPDGGIAESLQVKNGDLKRWHTMLDRIEGKSLNVQKKTATTDLISGEMNLDEERIKAREDKINEDPELFFRLPDNLKEQSTKLLIKASMPGVATSLGKGNPFIQSLALSVFSLFAHAFTQTSIIVKNDVVTGLLKKEKVQKKLSLLGALHEYSTRLGKLKDEETLDEKLELLFPLHHKYTEVLNLIATYEEAQLVPVARIRVRNNRMVIQPKTSISPLTLFQVVKKLWFQHPVRCSDRVFLRCLALFRTTFPWIKDTFEETLTASPFGKPIELYNFVSTQSARSRTIKLFGPAIRSNRLIGQVNQLIRKGFMKRHFLIRRSDGQTPGEVMDSSVAQLSLSLQIPVKKERVNRALGALSQISNSVISADELVNMNGRDAKVALIALMNEKRVSPEMLPKHLKELNQGILCTYTKPQKRITVSGKVHWTGPGEAIVLADGIHMRVTMLDDVATCVQVQSFTKLRSNVSTLRQVFDHLHVRSAQDFIFRPKCIARFNGTHFLSAHCLGTPVILNEKDIDVYVDPPNMENRIHYNKCGIYYRTKEREVAILEYRTGPRDVSLNMPGGIGTSPWDSWIKTKTLDSRRAFYFLRDVDEAIPEVTMTADQLKYLKDWVKSTLNARLKFKSIGYSDFVFAESNAADSLEDAHELDEEINQLLFDMTAGNLNDETQDVFSQFVGQLSQQTEEIIEEEALRRGDLPDEDRLVGIDVLLQYDYELSPFRTILGNYSHEDSPSHREVYKTTSTNYMYLHPFWDDFIQNLELDEPNFFYKALHGISSIRSPELSRLLFRILGIKEREQERSVYSRWVTEAREEHHDWFDE